MNSIAGWITVMVVGLGLITAWWVNWSEIVFYADTTWAWIMIILGGLALHMAPIGMSLYYMKGLGIWDYSRWLRNRKLKKNNK